MALKVWLPLNGTLDNLGTSNYNITAFRGSVTYNANGKIGQCFHSNGVNTLKINNILPDIYNYTAYSLCAWAYVESNNTSHTGSGIISAGNWNNQLLNLSMSDWSTDHYTKLRISGTNWNRTYNYNFYKNIWYHIVVCDDGVHTYAYVNGILIGDTATSFLPTSIEGTDICIGGATYYAGMQFFGRINDVRIYDHCLSAAEVREISQGLVLHYKLDDSLQNANWLTSNTTFSITRSSGNTFADSGYNATLISNSETSYRVECDAKGTASDMFFDVYFRNSSGAAYAVTSKTAITTAWQHYSLTINGSPSTMTIFRTRCYGGTAGDIIYIRNLRLISNSTPFNGNIEDSSGYNHNGTLTNTAYITSNTPRYSNAIYLSKVKINCADGFPAGENPNFTISFWTKILSTITYVSYGDLIGMYDTGQSSNTFRLELCGSPASNNLMWFRGPSGQSGGGFNMNSSSSSGWFTKDTWHHIVLAGDGINKKYYCYLDGNLCQTYNGSANNWQPTGQWYLGDTVEATAYFSDLRIYCTSFSANDVKQLYELGAKVDNLGNLHTFELNEYSINKLTKTGILKDNIIEPYITLSDGSHWKLLLFHWVDHGNNLFTSTNASYCNDFGLYSRLNEADNYTYNSKYEFYVLQDDHEFRWTQTNKPTAASPSGFTVVSGYASAVQGLVKPTSLTQTYFGYNSWWGACGSWTSYSTGGKTGIPGFGPHSASGICENYLALYTRIDDITFRMAHLSAYANNFIEL